MPFRWLKRNHLVGCFIGDRLLGRRYDKRHRQFKDQNQIHLLL